MIAVMVEKGGEELHRWELDIVDDVTLESIIETINDDLSLITKLDRKRREAATAEVEV